MSTRLRVLFHCELDGPRAYTGTMALRRMQQLADEHPQQNRVVSKSMWAELGRPQFVDKKLHWKSNPINGAPIPEVLYVLRPEVRPQSKASDFTVSVTAAKLLWKHLPQEVRKLSSLLVLRENRRNCWRQSQVNPRRHGWVAASLRTPKPSVPSVPEGIAPSTPSTGYYESSVQYITKGQLSADTAAVFGSGIENPAWKPNPPSGNKNPYLKSKKRAKYVPAVDGEIQIPGQTSSPAPSKPKLKLGIWS